MTRSIRAVIATFCLLLVAVSVSAQRRHDPLNEKEIDDLRETAQDPPKRMKLLITYAKARMDMIEHMRTDPKLAGENSEGIRKLLEDVATLVDEIDDNLDMFNQRTEDLRKPLKSIIEMDSDFQLKLRTIKEASSEAELRNIGFALETAADSVNESADSARAMLADQVAKRGKAKDNDKEDKDDEKKSKKKHSDDDSPKPPCSPC
jgi:hypothetical protein